MSHHDREIKAAIDCTGYGKEIDFETHRIIAGDVKHDAVDDFILMNQENEARWKAYLKKHYGF